MVNTSNMRTANVTDMVMVMMAAVRHGQHQQHENGESNRYGDGDGPDDMVVVQSPTGLLMTYGMPMNPCSTRYRFHHGSATRPGLRDSGSMSCPNNQ